MDKLHQICVADLRWQIAGIRKASWETQRGSPTPVPTGAHRVQQRSAWAKRVFCFWWPGSWWGAGWSTLCGNPWDFGVLGTLQDQGLCWSHRLDLEWKQGAPVWGKYRKYPPCSTLISIYEGIWKIADLILAWWVHGVFRDVFSSPGNSLPCFLVHEDALSAEITTVKLLVHALWEQRGNKRMARAQRNFCIWESSLGNLTGEKLPSKSMFLGLSRRKHFFFFCLVFICFFPLGMCACVHIQVFIYLLHWISDFICYSCLFPTRDHISTTLSSELLL